MFADEIVICSESRGHGGENRERRGVMPRKRESQELAGETWNERLTVGSPVHSKEEC